MPSPLVSSVADLVAGPCRPTVGKVLLRVLGYGLVYVVAAQLALSSRVPGTQLSLVWPSAGVAALWLLTSTHRTFRADLLALVVASLTATVASDATPFQTSFRVLANVALALVFRLFVDRWTALRRHDGSLSRLTRPGTLGRLAVAALVAGLAQASISELVSLLDGDASLLDFVHRWERNSIAVFAVVTTTLLLLELVARPGSSEERATLDAEQEGNHAETPDDGTPGPVEVVLLLIFTLGILVLSFGLLPELPMSFVLFLPSAWVGVRFPPAFAALHGLGVGVAVVGVTLTGHGMYAQIDDPVVQAFVAQGFLVIVFATTVLMSTIRTQLTTAQQRAQAHAQLLSGIVGTVDDGIALVDEAGKVLLLNQAASRLLGIPAVPDIDAVPLAGFFDMAGNPLTPDRLHHARALAGEEVRGEDMVVRPAHDGPDRVIRVNAQLMPTPAGAPRQVLVTCHDVTNERAHSAALAAFAGEVAHDLKNPLTVVEGWSEMLEGELRAGPTLDSTQGLSMVSRVQGAAAHMRELITELLTYTVARDRELDPERVVLSDLAAEVARLHQGGLGEQAPLIDLRCDDVVWADPLLLRQVLDNLVGNSVKYVAPGVRPRVVIASRPTGDGRIEVSIADNGLGVPPGDRRRVFDSLYRVDRPGYAGTGLGLAICQRIVERHGGRIHVEDGPDGEGSTFGFTLPRPVG